MGKKLPYKEGTWFALPLRTGGYAVGVVARMAPRGKIVLGYFFGPKRETIPSLSELVNLQPKDAIKCKQFGDLGLINGEWRIIGELENWNREVWRMPDFVRIDDLSRTAWRVIYPDSDPTRPIREERIPYNNPENLERDSLSGYGAAEIIMTKILDSKFT